MEFRSGQPLEQTSEKLTINPTRNRRINLSLDQVIPAIEPPKDTKYVKHVRIKSRLLSDFWGRPMHPGAHVPIE